MGAEIFRKSRWIFGKYISLQYVDCAINYPSLLIPQRQLSFEGRIRFRRVRIESHKGFCLVLLFKKSLFEHSLISSKKCAPHSAIFAGTQHNHGLKLTIRDVPTWPMEDLVLLMLATGGKHARLTQTVTHIRTATVACRVDSRTARELAVPAPAQQVLKSIRLRLKLPCPFLRNLRCEMNVAENLILFHFIQVAVSAVQATLAKMCARMSPILMHISFDLSAMVITISYDILRQMKDKKSWHVARTGRPSVWTRPSAVNLLTLTSHYN